MAAGCAKVGPPSGGPVDRSSPSVSSHYPPPDAVGVSVDSRIELVFSEPMDRKSTGDAVFVSPAAQIRQRWRGRRLELVLEPGLQPDRTYVITLGTGARDLRRNALERSFTFAFATGDVLNQGRLRGWVFEAHEPVATAHVWAYDLAHFDGRVGRDPPHYRTQTGRDGSYEFSRLSASSYRVLAFVDRNRNAIWDEGESLGLPAGDVPVGDGEQVRVGDLALVQRAGPAPSLRRAHAVHRRRVVLQFEQAVAWDEVGVALRGLVVQGGYGAPGDGRKVYLTTAPQEAGKAYPFDLLEVGGTAVEWEEPVRGSARPDRAPPTLVEWLPGAAMAPGDSLSLRFSEAMEASVPREFWLVSDSTQSPAGRWQWQGPTELIFVPGQPWEPGPYHLRGRGAMLRDQAGLALADSLVTVEFEVLGAEELGRISGRAINGVGPVWIVAEHQKQGREHKVRADSSGAYVMERLLPGTYVVTGFVDASGDRAWEHGSLEPYRPAEPYCRNREKLTVETGQSLESVELEF